MATTTVDLILFEVLERAVRLYSHIDRSCKVASRPGARTTAQLKIAKERKSLLSTLIEDIIDSYSKEATPEQVIYELRRSLDRLAFIHTSVLGQVPRPHEPIELISYLRQTLGAVSEIKNTAFNTKLPAVFGSEFLGDQAHQQFQFIGHELSKLETEAANATFGSLLDFAEKHLDSPLEQKIITPHVSGFVSLPRIDLGNPCRWPSLLHEVGHFQPMLTTIFDDFSEYIGQDLLHKAKNCISKFSTDLSDDALISELTSWLRECWCDAFSVACAGPSAFFAQMHAFLFISPSYLTQAAQKGAGYPPAWFRIKLILSLAESRFKAEDIGAQDNIFRHMEAEKKRVYTLFNVEESERSPETYFLLHLFRRFLAHAFPKDDFLHISTISAQNLTKLINDLRDGLPIPSVTDEQTMLQRAASPAEILLAGWLHRCNDFKSEFIEIVQEFGSDPKRDFSAMVAILRAKVDRADECLKRSLQVVEWFKLLDAGLQNSSTDDSSGLGNVRLPNDASDSSGGGLLSDGEIKRLLYSNDLRVIPLIDLHRQVSGSVVDLRLGHNFEVFFTNIQGAIDPLQRRVGDFAESMEMDVDFLNSISISPGQFILGHTLEYIKLPPGIAAQIEGRSSFARLGLQIHMTANLVEAGFDGCLTLEIANCGHSSIVLYPGMRIAQLRLFKLSGQPLCPYGKIKSNKYRGRLSHNKTEQFSDWEVKAFKDAKSALINPAIK